MRGPIAIATARASAVRSHSARNSGSVRNCSAISSSSVFIPRRHDNSGVIAIVHAGPFSAYVSSSAADASGHRSQGRRSSGRGRDARCQAPPAQIPACACRDRNQARALRGAQLQLATFPEAPLRSRTVGFPESGSGLGSARHFSGRAFPQRAKLRCWRTLRPDAVEFASPLRHDAGPAKPSAVSGCLPTVVTTECPEPLCPERALPAPGRPREPPGGALPPRRRSYGLMRQTIPLPAPRLAPCARGLCRLSPVPAGRWPFPTLSPRSLRRCSDPYPAALLGCACPLLHRGHRSHPTLDGFDARIYPHMATSVGSPISRLQSFVYLRAPTLARPPGCSHRSSPKAAGRPGLSHHASPGRLPGPGCGVATCSTRTISMTGLSPAGSRPCRPLPNALGSR